MLEPIHPSHWPPPNDTCAPEFVVAINNGLLDQNTFSEIAQLILGDPKKITVITPSHGGAVVTMGAVLVAAGLFPSKGQARKAGADVPLPDGLSCFIVGKLKTRVWIWVPIAETVPQTENKETQNG